MFETAELSVSVIGGATHVYYAGPMSAPKCPSYQELLRAALGLLRAEKKREKLDFTDLRN